VAKALVTLWLLIGGGAAAAFGRLKETNIDERQAARMCANIADGCFQAVI
jgi:hypothetical protein